MRNMNKYSEIEKLGQLLSKGLITESEYHSEKVKLLSSNQNIDSKAAPPKINDGEISKIKQYDERYLAAKRLASTGKYAELYLTTAAISVIFILVSSGIDKNNSELWEYLVFGLTIFAFPAIFVFPIYLMRSKQRKRGSRSIKSNIFRIIYG